MKNLELTRSLNNMGTLVADHGAGGAPLLVMTVSFNLYHVLFDWIVMDQSETRRLAHSLVTILTLQRLLNGRRDNFERLTITMSELPSFEEKEFPYEGTNEFTSFEDYDTGA